MSDTRYWITGSPKMTVSTLDEMIDIAKESTSKAPSMIFEGHLHYGTCLKCDKDAWLYPLPLGPHMSLRLFRCITCLDEEE